MDNNFERMIAQRTEQRIAEFDQAAQTMQIATVNPSVDMRLAQPASVAASEFEHEKSGEGSKLYLVPELAAHIGEVGIAGFEPYITAIASPQVSSLNNIRSGHGMFFGEMALNDGTELPVAVKPHYLENCDAVDQSLMRKSCLRDFYTNVAATKGSFENFKPLGFVLKDDGTPFSLTLLDTEISSFDQTDWTRFFRPGFETTGMREMWDKAAMRAAVLHDMGNSFHGDMYARNLATTPQGHHIKHDWEKGNVTLNRDVDPKLRPKLTSLDLKAVMRSMVLPESHGGIAMFTENTGDWWDDFRDLFLDRYLEYRYGLAVVSHQKGRLKQVGTELGDMEDKLRMEMLMLQDELQPVFQP